MACVIFSSVGRAKAYEMFPGNIKASEKFWMTGFVKGLILPTFYIRSTRGGRQAAYAGIHLKKNAVHLNPVFDALKLSPITQRCDM